MGNVQPPYSEAQIEAFGMLPRFFAIPSMIGCTYVIQHILRSRERRNKVYHRLVLAMTVNDVGWTLKNLLSTWPIPQGFPGALHAVGTQASCTTVAFIGQGSTLASILYSGGLTLFFFMVIRHGWTERQNVKLEWAIHFFALTIGWGTAIAGLPLTLYNPHPISCGIQAYPPKCTQSYQATEDNPPTCTRGDNAGMYLWAFFWVWLWTTFAFSAVCMLLIYGAMRKLERRLAQYEQPVPSMNHYPSSSVTHTAAADNSSTHQSGDATSSGAPGSCQEPPQEQPPPSSTVSVVSASARNSTNININTTTTTTTINRIRRSRDFAVQASLYCGFFFLTWIFPTLSNALNNFANKSYAPIIYLAGILPPLQGFFNFVIYVRPRYLAYRKRQLRRRSGDNQQGAKDKENARRGGGGNWCRFWCWEPTPADNNNTSTNNNNNGNADVDPPADHDNNEEANGGPVRSLVERDLSRAIIDAPDYLM